MLNPSRTGAPVSADVAPPPPRRELVARAAARGVALEVRQAAHDGDAADEVLRVADETAASVIVIGLRRCSPVDERSPAHPAPRPPALLVVKPS